MSGIYAGDGEQLSLAATFPNLRQLEREYGSVTRGLLEGGASPAAGPPFLSLRGGMRELVTGLADRLVSTRLVTGRRSHRCAVAAGAAATCWTSRTATRSRRGGRARDTGVRHRRSSWRPWTRSSRSPRRDPVCVDGIVTLAYPSTALPDPSTATATSSPASRAPTSSPARGRRANGRDERPRRMRSYASTWAGSGAATSPSDSDEELVARPAGEIATTLAPTTGPPLRASTAGHAGCRSTCMGSLERLAADRAPPARAPGPRPRRSGLPRRRHTRLHRLGRAAAETVLAGRRVLERAS